MIKFTIRNCYTQVKDETSESLEAINNICTFKYQHFLYRWVCLHCKQPTVTFKYKIPFCRTCKSKKSFSQIKRYPRTEVTDLKYFKDNKFPTGLLPRIIDILKLKNIEYTWIDRRQKFEHSPLEANLPELRYYQLEAIKESFKKKRGIIHLPTRSGKTYISMGIIFALGERALVIVPNLILLHQTFDLFREHIKEKRFIGIIGDSVFEPSMVNIATIQTIHSRFEDPTIQKILNDTKILVIDEAHHVSFAKKGYEFEEMNTWMKVTLSCDAYYRIGLTATPGKEKDIERKLLESVTGNIIYEIPLKTLIDEGYVAQPKIIIKKFKHNNPTWSEWRGAEKRGIRENKKRCEFIANIVKENSNKRILIFVDKIKHAEFLLKYIPNALYLNGKDSSKKRKEVIKEFEEGNSGVLVSTLFGEGVTLQFTTLILASSFKKERKLLQLIGRVLNVQEGKEFGEIIDIYDEDDGILERQAKARKRIYKKEKFKIF